MPIDRIDRQIIACLTENARSSFREIGVRVGLSAPAVKRRVDRLQDDGVITGFTTRIDPAQAGWRTQGFVAVTFGGNVQPARIATMLAPIAEVIAAYTVSGDADVLVHLRAADMAHFEQALEYIRAAEGVVRTESTIVLSGLLDRPQTVVWPAGDSAP